MVITPALIFAVWIVFFRTSPYGPHPTPSDVVSFIGESWVVLTATTTGLSGVLSEPIYSHPLAKIAGAILFAALAAVAIANFRRLRAPFWASLAGLFVLLASPRLSPEGLLRTPDAPRYLYPEAILFLLSIIGVAGAAREAGGRASRGFAPAAILATGLLGLGIWANVDELSDASRDVRSVSTDARGQFSAYEIERPRIDRSFVPNAFFPNAGDYLDASAAYGAIGRSASALPEEPLAVRTVADATMSGALGIKLETTKGEVVDPPRRGRGLRGRSRAPLGGGADVSSCARRPRRPPRPGSPS